MRKRVTILVELMQPMNRTKTEGAARKLDYLWCDMQLMNIGMVTAATVDFVITWQTGVCEIKEGKA